MAEDHYAEFTSKRFVGLSVLLALVFWAVFTRLLLPFVPAETQAVQYTVAGFTSACLTGVFFLAVHMFQLVFKESRKARREREYN
ncbi:MAG: hypothetical protein GVY10_04980 [Verrucomicrobia bacterium]|jgi:hypothetical protein|nr:hypothetical protein [Verrucomicrobiota bacterium]